MSRKKEPTCVTEKYIFPTRLRELMESYGTTQKKLADAIEMRPQTVSLYTTGQSAPDVNTLRKISEFFHVSADYLIGLTDVKKPDITIQAICEYTGLSEESISCLNKFARYSASAKRDHFVVSLETSPVINHIITNKKFQSALASLAEIEGIAYGVAQGNLGEYPFPEANLASYCKYLQFKATADINTILEQYTSQFITSIEEEGGPDNAIHQRSND